MRILETFLILLVLDYFPFLFEVLFVKIFSLGNGLLLDFVIFSTFVFILAKVESCECIANLILVLRD